MMEVWWLNDGGVVAHWLGCGLTGMLSSLVGMSWRFNRQLTGKMVADGS
jgi:hypothetical protein